MTHRTVWVILLSIATVARANAQTGASSPKPPPPSARAAADFPEEPSSERGEPVGYLVGNIGLSATSDVTAPTGDIEVGVHVSKHLSVFGGYGFLRNLEPSTLQPYVDIAVTQIAQRNIHVTGQPREAAQYAWGGLRFDVPTAIHVSPYVMAGGGWARSAPSAQFTYAAGSATVNGGTATAGQDATNDVLSTGVFVGDSWNAVMVRWAAGLSVPIRGAWGVEGRYSWSRMFAPNTVNAQGLTAGVTFQF